VDTGEMAVEGGQFRDPPVGVGDPGLDQPQQLVAHGGADVAVTGVEEFADLVQAEAEMFGRGDECQPVHGGVVVDAVARRGAFGG
jgi:hypothetical protein